MKLERSRNTKRNIGVGIINKVATLLLPFAVQTVFIRTLGAEYLGLRGVFSSVLQVLSLAELGFGSAMVFNMYDAIADDNDRLICALLLLYKRVYRYIGFCVLTVSVFFVPFIPKVIKGDYPHDINIYIIYGMYITNTVLSYWMFAYKNSLFNAFQRQDVMGIINMAIQSLANIAQIIYLIISKNFYIYLVLQIFSTVITNIMTSIMADKIFPQYKCAGKVPTEIISRTKKKMAGLLLYRACGVTRNSFDSIFVSMFLGLAFAGMYNNYYYIISSVGGLLSIITSALLAGVGNSIASESKEKNRMDMDKIDFIYMILAGWCAVCMLCLYQPFMKIWAGEGLIFPFSIVVLFVIYFYLLCMGNIRALYNDAAGLWWENRHRIVCEAIVNIFLNYFLGKWWGVFGIILATIFPLFLFGYIASAVVLFNNYFKSGLKEYFMSHFLYLTVTFFICVATGLICSLIKGNSIFVLLMRAAICCTIAPVLYFLIYFRTQRFKDNMTWLKIRLRR